MKHYLGIDVGGTNLAVGVVDENNRIVARATAPCPKTPCPGEEFCRAVADVARKALANAGLTPADVPWVGLGCPGAVNHDTGIIEFANNLHFSNFPLRDMLRPMLDGTEVLLENDANAAAYGEYMAGSLQGARNAVAITLGTGIGSGIIIDGKIYAGSNYAAGEMGHTVIVKDGYPCSCGRRGCWESYASATGLIRCTRDAMQANRESKMWELAGNDLEKVNGRTAFDAMRAGDPAGRAVVDDYLAYLSVGLVNVVNIFQPDILCIGGGISNEGETLLAPVRAYVDREQYAMNASKKTKIVRAALGNDAGIIGAALLGK